jgi:hypothetical protein
MLLTSSTFSLDFHILLSLLSSQTSYPLIGLCQSNPYNRLHWHSTQVSNGNYVSLYTQLPTNQFVLVAPLLIFLAITSSNAHASAKLVFTMLFVTVLHILWPQFSPPPDLSPTILQLTRNPTFTSHLTLTFVSLTSHLTHTQPYHHSHPKAVPPTPTPLVPISPSAPYLPSFLLILIPRMFYKLSRPMPTHIYGNMNKTGPSTSIITHGDTLIGNLLH